MILSGKKSRLRLFAAVLCALFLLMTTAGCGKDLPDGGAAVEKESGQLKIVCTIFPEYDWTRQILGDLADQAELTLLLKNGSDLHSYQPTVWDMVKISDADLFIYVGGESDFWVENALNNVKNPAQKTLNLMELLQEQIQEEEVVEGMQDGEHSHGHTDGHDHENEPDHEEAHHEEEVEYDEHVWLSLRNAQSVCRAIEEAVSELDPQHQEIYEENLNRYLARLEALDLEYERAVEQSSRPVLLFGDRFPFRYLAEDYDLTYYAAFSGCAADTEASFETIAFLAQKADELSLPAVLCIDGSDQRIAHTIADNTQARSQQVYCMNSMQSVSEREIEDGTTYLSIMEENLEVLKKALP